VSRGAKAMKHAFDASAAAAAGRALTKLGSRRKLAAANMMAGCVTPWGRGLAAKESKQAGERRTEQRRQRVTEELTAKCCSFRTAPLHLLGERG
jgi:hypothetical protein